jgi:hypothetical protein
MPAAGALTEVQLRLMAQVSNEAVASLGVPHRWVTSYVTGDKIYCVHDAEDVDAVIEHARRCGFPVDVISVVVHDLGPSGPAQRSVAP